MLLSATPVKNSQGKPLSQSPTDTVIASRLGNVYSVVNTQGYLVLVIPVIQGSSDHKSGNPEVDGKRHYLVTLWMSRSCSSHLLLRNEGKQPLRQHRCRGYANLPNISNQPNDMHARCAYEDAFIWLQSSRSTSAHTFFKLVRRAGLAITPARVPSPTVGGHNQKIPACPVRLARTLAGLLCLSQLLSLQ